jgi:hypothetical protein
VRRETRAAHPGSRCIGPTHAGFALFPVFLSLFSLLLFIFVFSCFFKSEQNFNFLNFSKYEQILKNKFRNINKF